MWKGPMMSMVMGPLCRFRNLVRQVSRVICRRATHSLAPQSPAWHSLEPMEPRLLLSSSPLLPAALAESLAPNVILMIGDGMGPGQIEAAAAYLGNELSFEF